MRSLFRFPVRMLVAAVAVGVAWCSPLAADRTITVLGPGAGPGEVAIDASPPFADPVFAAWLRPSTIDGRMVVTVATLREPSAQATVYQVLPGAEVVVSGERVLDQLEFPRDRTAVDLVVDGFGRDVYQITVSAPLTAPPGDFNQDGARSVQDIFEFLAAWQAWQAGSPRADVDGSGSCGPQDIFEFIGRYFGAG